MASVLDRYGIKEVADVTFYKLDNNGIPMYPVLYLDTLKVSTIEQTAETSDARGGKGNPKLISWDYNKEITVTLEDALFSAKSMAIMFGNGVPSIASSGASASQAYIMRTEQFTCNSTSDVQVATLKNTGADFWSSTYTGPNGKTYTKVNPKFYADNINTADRNSMQDLTTLESGKTYFCSYDLLAEGSVIEISGNTFPGTYYVTGDTYARSDASGEDEFFQFIIPKAKVSAENTITLEAEGDPSVFNMNLTVLRPADGVMMKLVKYDLVNGADAAAASNYSNLVHNHALDDQD